MPDDRDTPPMMVSDFIDLDAILDAIRQSATAAIGTHLQRLWRAQRPGEASLPHAWEAGREPGVARPTAYDPFSIEFNHETIAALVDEAARNISTVVAYLELPGAAALPEPDGDAEKPASICARLTAMTLDPGLPRETWSKLCRLDSDLRAAMRKLEADLQAVRLDRAAMANYDRPRSPNLSPAWTSVALGGGKVVESVAATDAMRASEISRKADKAMEDAITHAMGLGYPLNSMRIERGHEAGVDLAILVVDGHRAFEVRVEFPMPDDPKPAVKIDGRWLVNLTPYQPKEP